MQHTNKSVSLHLGLNRVDPGHYQNLRDLRAAVNDARDWAQMAKEFFGYQKQEILTDEQATSKALFERLKTLAGELQAGDALLLTYAGHGGQLEDPLSPTSGDEDKDETWCLYDRQVVDDELFIAFSRFGEGVRISVIADCCHSGTGIKDVPENVSAAEIAERNIQIGAEKAMEEAGFLPRRLTKRQQDSIFIKNNLLYNEILSGLSAEKPQAAASVQLFAACQDQQVTFDGKRNGIFTDAFKTLVQSGEWRQLRDRNTLLERLRAFFRYPRPNRDAYGPGLSVFDQNFPLLADLPPLPQSGVPEHRETPQPEARPAAAQTETSPPRQAVYKVKIEHPDGKLDRELVQSLCPAPVAEIELAPDAKTALLWFPGGNYPSVWEPVHHIAEQADAKKINLFVEPVAQPASPLVDDAPEARATDEDLDYLPFWPPITEQQNPPLGWHLDDKHSQLAAAREFVWKKIKNGELTERVRIAQLDTGWYPWHPGFEESKNILKDLARSFVDKEKGVNEKAVDLRYKKAEQHGHGTGTLGVLAGSEVAPEFTGGVAIGPVGAMPFAEVAPLRIADNVVVWDSENFCEALEYALEIGCEVITLSMGGKPSRRMAKVINRAYDKGVTVVAAGGNNFAKGLAGIGPKTLVYPARFDRVIAACGACHNQLPYDFEAQEKYGGKIRSADIRHMQGNWGPAKPMKTALAAYSPNITWLYQDENQQHPIRKNGGGTSATTPQIAAAAALWLTLHRAELKRRGYHGNWKQVEAVRQALFGTADKSFAESQKYYGNGILRAMDALNFGVPDIGDNQKSEEADSSLFGLNEALKLFLHRRRADQQPGPALQRSLELELQYLLLDDDDIATRDAAPADELDRIRQAVQRAEHCSEQLRASVGG